MACTTPAQYSEVGCLERSSFASLPADQTWLPHVHVIKRATLGFTQGFVVYEGQLFETTGLLGASELRQLDVRTGSIVRRVRLPPDVFGEGAVAMDGRVIIGTWRGRRLLIYDLNNFELQMVVPYEGEIWGLSATGTEIIVSDGSSTLRLLDPDAFRIIREVEVTYLSHELKGLNELEWIEGKVWANVWPTEEIFSIDIGTGIAQKAITASDVLPKAKYANDADNVLNGIAFDRDADHLFLTGKNWDSIFQISVCH